ncbi:uncharacterized protein LOC141698196 [Apium graveolens]|uniref:uncharacterized protein LOC141698196 n=1 Tax=Apium graveolens TaxID=4045 RepID=UPI003D7B12F8
MYMDSLEKLNSAIKLTETKKEHVQKAMLSLLVEWKDLEGHLDSSTQRLLQDCFTDIQSREDRLNQAEQSVTTSNQVLNEIRNSLENRMEEVERKEKDFEKYFEDKYEELGFQERRVDEKRGEVEAVFDKFCAEKRELEGIRDFIEERFEVVKLKEKSIVNREVKLEVIWKNLAEREKGLEAREKELALMRDLNEKRSKEVESMVSKDKEIEMVKKITHDLCTEFNLQKVKLDMENKELNEKVKEFEVKEKCFKEWVETIDKREKEIDAKNVLSEERIKGLEIKEKKLQDRLKGIELEEKRLRESVEAMDLKNKEIELMCVSSEETCRGVEIREKKLQDQLKEFEFKEKHFKDWVGSMDLKEKEIDLKNALSEERYRKLQVSEKKLDDQMKEFEEKEKHFREQVKNIEMKKTEVESGRILNEERCKRLNLMEKDHQKLLTEFKLLEQQFGDRFKSFEYKEKEVNSIKMSCEERCRKFELEKRKLQDQINESEMKKKQFSNVDHSIVKPEPCSVDGSYADIRFSITMGGKNLLLYLISHKRDLDSMTDEIFRALRMSMNPGKLVLDALQDFYLIMEDKEFEGDVVCKSSVLLLEQLRRISQVQPRLKKVAMELAHEWKNKMKTSSEVIVFLNLLATYGLGSAFDPDEFLSLFEVICQHVQTSKLSKLLDDTDKINLIEVMLKKQQHVKAVKYVCDFGLQDKFQPASLLKDLFKNAEETAYTWRENSDYPVNKKDEAIDNIVASLREALVCIFYYKLESEYSPESMGRFIKQLLQEKEDKQLTQEKEDEKVSLSASKNDAAKQEAENNCSLATIVLDPAEDCVTTLTSPFLCNRNALAFILSNMDALNLRVFLSENLEDHEVLSYDIFNVLKLSFEPAKLVLDAIQGLDPALSEMGDKNFESPGVMRSCILLLEQLMKQSPEIKPRVKEAAIKLACEWRAKMRAPVQVLGFLHLVSAYGLNSSFDASELKRHFESVSCINYAHELCQVFRPPDKRTNQTTSSSLCHWHQNSTSTLEINKKKNQETKLIYSANFPKLVLDAIRSCYYSNCNRRVKSFAVKCFIILLELLSKTSSQIQPHVKEKATKFAVDWKARLVNYNSKKPVLPVEVYGLFHLLAVYQVVSAVDSNELFALLDSIYQRRMVPKLVRLLGLSHRISDLVKSLIQKGDRMQAIRYIYEFELVGEFPPVPILKDHLNFKEVTEASHVPKVKNVLHKQIGALRDVIKCIKDHQLEAEYSPENLLALAKKLENQACEVREEIFRSKFTKKPDAASGPAARTHNFLKKQHAVPGPETQKHKKSRRKWPSGPEAQTQKFVKKPHAAPGPEAQTRKKFKRKRRAAGLNPGPDTQTQWHVSKHPRIDPPVGTPLNVPSTFSSMTNFTHCDGAYLQRGPDTQLPWHTSRNPRIEQLVGTSLNVPSPAFQYMINFPKPLPVNPRNAPYG